MRSNTTSAVHEDAEHDGTIKHVIELFFKIIFIFTKILIINLNLN